VFDPITLRALLETQECDFTRRTALPDNSNEPTKEFWPNIPDLDMLRERGDMVNGEKNQLRIADPCLLCPRSDAQSQLRLLPNYAIAKRVLGNAKFYSDDNFQPSEFWILELLLGAPLLLHSKSSIPSDG
jgi:hypothetical protein